MPLFHLTGPDDARAVPYRAIPDPALLRSHGLFIVEGRLLVQRLLATPRFRIRSVLMNDAAYATLRETLDAHAPDIDLLLASSDAMRIVGGHDFHRGCLALVERPAALTLADLDLATTDVGDSDRGDSVLRDAGLPDSGLQESGSRESRHAGPGQDLLVVLEGVSNADNVGGIFRNAAAFGARAVLLGPRCCDPLYRKATRTSMGATLRVPFAPLPDWPASLHTLRAHGYRIAALTPHAPAVDIDRFATTHRGTRLALLLGAEGEGLTTEALEASTDRVMIPMSSAMESINVTTAAGIALQRLASLAALGSRL